MTTLKSILILLFFSPTQINAMEEKDLDSNKLVSQGGLHSLQIASDNFTIEDILSHIEAPMGKEGPTYVNLSGSEIDDKKAEILIQFLKDIPDLRELNLRVNQISGNSIPFLTSLIIDSSNLTCLYLTNNPLGDEGVEQLAKILLREAKSLKELDLCFTETGTKGALALAEVLKFGTAPLELLDIGSNANIKGRGMRAIAKALKINKRLTHLDVSSNFMDRKITREFADAFKLNTTLLTVNFDGCSFSDSEFLILSVGLHKNTSLTFVNMTGTEADKDIKESITSLVRKDLLIEW